MVIYKNIVKPKIPSIEPVRIEEIKSLRRSLNIARVVETANLEQCVAPLDNFLRGLLDFTDVARIRSRNVKDVELCMQIESCFWTIVKIQYEKTLLPVSRKTEGYISTNSTVLKVVQERLEALLESEYQKRYSRFLSAQNIYRSLQLSVETIESTPMGRMIRTYGGIQEIQKKISTTPMFGSARFSDIVERNVWRGAAHQWEANAPVGHVVERPVEIKRRAEDTDQWKRMESSGVFDWEKSFQTLGPFFTCRILLRREQFHEIEKWVDHTPFHNDLGRILTDCEVTRESLIKKGLPEKKILELEKILEKLRLKIYRD